MLFFLIFPETVRAEEEDQVGPQAQEDFHNSSTDSCLTFPYSSNSPRPFPPSPVHSVTDSPKRVSPLPIATSNSSSDNPTILSPIVHNFPTPALSTLPISIPSQTFTSILFTPTTDSQLSNAITFIKSPKVLKRCFTPLTRLIRSSTPYSKFKLEVLRCVHTSGTN